MLKRIGALLAAAILGVVVAAPPAQASTVNGCSTSGLSVSICLTNWVDWEQGGGFWRRTVSEIFDMSNDCASLQNHYWHNGGIVYDSPPSSFVINRDAGATAYEVRFYDWVGCNWEGGYLKYQVAAGSTLVQDDNLSIVPAGHYFYDDSNWYNKISSVRVCANECV